MSQLSSFLRRDTMIGIAMGAATFVVYLLTLSRSIGYEDPGELAAAVHGLGVVHPTGYPLFSMLGRVFSILPLGDLRVIVKLNLMGAIFCATAATAFYHLMLILLRDAVRADSGKSKRGAQSTASETAGGVRIAAATGALVFAFSRIYWNNAVSVEVYALHLLFLSIVTLLFLRAQLEPDCDRTWILFAYVLGLSFANHMMTVLLAPAFLFLFFTTHGNSRAAWIRIIKAAPPFLLGLTPYLYLPIRASTRPLMNWGDPSSLEAFWTHVSAGQYRSFMFSSTKVAETKLGDFIASFPSDFGYLPIALALIGLGTLWLRSKRILIFFVLLFVTSLLYAVNYDFEDPNFYLNAHLATAVCAAWGLCGISGILGKGSDKAWATALAIPIIALPLALNWKHADRSQDYGIEDFTRNILESVDSGAVILTGAYPVFTSAAFYLQIVEEVRPDVVVIQNDMFSQPWYHAHLEARDPTIFRGLQEEIEEHRRLLVAAKGSALQGDHGRRLIYALIRTTQVWRPMHATGDLEPEKRGASFQGMTYRFYPDAAQAPPYDGPEPRFRPIKLGDARLDYINTSYATMYANSGILRLNRGDSAGALSKLRIAAALNPGHAEIALRLRQLEAAP